ncbi:MAG TPA: type II secretion system F family protein [Humisphaera sp.]|jgi:type II secretory pathway component PulF|nr:type II secretion system F family protein [Humisphaera sp.]
MRFRYEACDAGGAPRGGLMEAANQTEAMDALRRQGLFVSHIEQSRGGALPQSSYHGKRRMGRSRLLKNLAVFSRQLYLLVSSGTQITEALHSLQKQSKDLTWRAVMGDLCRSVEQGEPLSAAMLQHPQCFDPVCRSLVAAGEAGGNLANMLDRLASMTRKQMQTRSAIIGALIYPSLLITVAVGVLLLMLLFVLPRFADMFKSLAVPLPTTTRLLMDLSGALQSYWWIALSGLAAAIVGFRVWAKTNGGREILHKVVLTMPIAGRLVRSFSVARIMRILGVLGQGSVPLLDALGLARQTATNLQFIRLMSKAEAAVTRGSTISNAFSESPLIESSLCEAIRSGEQSGQLANLLLNLADFLDEENEIIVRSLTSILEPVILIALGVVVGFVAMSMFLPMFDLTAMTQHG